MHKSRSLFYFKESSLSSTTHMKLSMPVASLITISVSAFSIILFRVCIIVSVSLVVRAKLSMNQLQKVSCRLVSPCSFSTSRNRASYSAVDVTKSIEFLLLSLSHVVPVGTDLWASSSVFRTKFRVWGNFATITAMSPLYFVEINSIWKVCTYAKAA